MYIEITLYPSYTTLKNKNYIQEQTIKSEEDVGLKCLLINMGNHNFSKNYKIPSPTPFLKSVTG